MGNRFAKTGLAFCVLAALALAGCGEDNTQKKVQEYELNSKKQIADMEAKVKELEKKAADAKAAAAASAATNN